MCATLKQPQHPFPLYVLHLAMFFIFYFIIIIFFSLSLSSNVLVFYFQPWSQLQTETQARWGLAGLGFIYVCT